MWSKGKVGCWLSSFLDSNTRKQAVTVDGRVSPLIQVLSGVPQGTVLGPVLFLIHIRNIANGISHGTSATSFAADTRVHRGSDLSVIGLIYRQTLISSINGLIL